MHKSNSTHATALLFQHRKRYGLHAMKTSSFLDLWFGGFNTASGMDCMQSASRCSRLPVCQVSIPQAVRIACNCGSSDCSVHLGRFNTASGTDCMQYPRCVCDGGSSAVSIPQAVRIACNRTRSKRTRAFLSFQYRKRYGLHAMDNGGFNFHPLMFQYRKRYGLHAIGGCI